LLVESPPSGGWTVEHLDALPESHYRYELTDGALTVSPSLSGLHQAVTGRLCALLDGLAPEPFAATWAMEIRFGRQLTRIPDVLVVRTGKPCQHWFAPAEVVLAVEIESPGSHVEDRATRPALYAQYGIPYFWRVELDPVRINGYRLGPEDRYQIACEGERLTVTEPFELDIAVRDLLPRWARD
jgi:Uma2 family endonuclease